MKKYSIEKTKYAFSIKNNEIWKVISYNQRFSNYFLSIKEIEDFINNYEWNNLMKELQILNDKKFEDFWLNFTDNLESILLWKDWIEKKILFLSWLNKRLQESYEWQTILVWWSAVEFWTNSNIKSIDINIIYKNNDILYEILKNHWFKMKWRYIINEELDIFLESPSDILEWEKEPEYVILDWKETNVLVISLEDLIVDRLEQWNQWNEECKEHIEFMLYSWSRVVDIDYVRKRCKDLNLRKTIDNIIND